MQTLINNTRYENYIRIGHNATGSFGNYVCTDLQDFPVPTSMKRKLHDVDVDAYTDLMGFTHRNRVRHDVEDFTLGYSVLNDDDEQYILNRIGPEWVYVELIDKKTKQKSIHKMYASDKEWDTYHAFQDSNGDWHDVNTALTFSMTEE